MPRRVKTSTPIVDRLLTLEEVATRLGFSPRTIRKYVQSGELEGRLIGGRWRFTPASVSAFFENAPRNWEFVGNNDHGD
jgi:excisionase family DNA binding protein